MSQNSLVIDDEESGPLTIKLSQSGRISLSDITAATIGNLETWDNVDSLASLQNDLTGTNVETSVLRPWEDNSQASKVSSTAIEKGQNLTYNTNSSSKVCESGIYVESANHSNSSENLKRQLEDFYTIADGPQLKRQRQNVSTNINTTDDFKHLSLHNKSMPHNASVFNLFQVPNQNSNHNSADSALINAYKVSENYAYPSLSGLFDTQPSQEICARLNMKNNQESKMTVKKYESTGSSLDRTSSLGSISNFYRDHFKVKDAVNSYQCSPNVNFFKSEPVSPITKQASNFSTRNMCNNPVDFFKYEPSTPVAKQPMALSGNHMYDSPGVEARFNESLSNLIGSPPPESPLSKNLFFSDLQALLSTECKSELLPKSLFSMHETIPKLVEEENIFVRERRLHDRFNDLQASHPDEIRNLSSFFRYQTAMIETERFRTLHESQYPKDYKASVNHHYDNKIHRVIDRVEQSVILLENANKENAQKRMTIKPRPQLNREGVQLMENWYLTNKDHPYPTNTTIELLAQSGNISVDQVKKWFANKRNRSQNTRTLTEIAMKKRKLGQLASQS